jgi:hypothetical protein
MGHALTENRNGLLVDACLTRANGHPERIAALHMIEPRTDRGQSITVGADHRSALPGRVQRNGRGPGDDSAKLLDDGSIEIEFAYHNGDEAVLKAKGVTSSTTC